MIEYIKCKVTYINNNKLIIESSGIGFCINTTNFFPLNSFQTIYIYIKKTENEDIIYGFKDIKTKELFLYFMKKIFNYVFCFLIMFIYIFFLYFLLNTRKK